MPRFSQDTTSERVPVSAASTSAATTPEVRARTASRNPRGSCPCTASTRRTASSADDAGVPLSSCAVHRAATAGRTGTVSR